MKRQKRGVDKPDNRLDLSELMDVLTRIANLLALVSIKDQRQEHQVLTLSAAGYTPAEIAKLIHTTPNTVRVTLSTAKARNKQKKSKKL